MAFTIRPKQEFLVRPDVPKALARLPELAYNILWGWEPTIRMLFRRLDPVMWKDCGNNPVALLGRVSQATLNRSAGEPRYLALYAHACERFDAHMNRPAPVETEGELVAYFSMEYGLSECLPIYSGGLGILSGDHLKSASDCDIPLVGIALLYQQGYFRQYLNPDGWQQERYLDNDFYALPIQPAVDAQGNKIRVEVHLPTGPVAIKVWFMDVGRVKLYLLDTNIAANGRAEDRGITAQLYGGDNDTRIRQEIVLGIGGIRALDALGLRPTVFHMNEGHSAFLAVERIRQLMAKEGLNFDEALEASRGNNVFTTHTPVPAGIDIFDPGIMRHYFDRYCGEAGIPLDRFMGLGRRNPYDQGEALSMAILALNCSAYRNSVSRLHQKISQEMWSDLWPMLPSWETPITSVTNGVHLPSWLNGDLADLYDQYLSPDWRERWSDRDIWRQLASIPDEELQETHRRRKRRLISFIRDRQTASASRRKAAASEVRYSAEVLDPNALAIGFARRFATYKRATLLFRDIDRLKKILCHPEYPVQIIISGKAHPRDTPGKSFIRDIVQLSRDADLWKHVVFVEDYDMKVARELVQGVDLWLNTPRRGEEACGTSGMKASMNGVLNLSVLDGWFDEADEDSGGWAIGDREPYSEDQDAIHASNIYYLLENEIVPMFYAQRSGAPSEWSKRVKHCIMNITPRFDARRMVTDYQHRLYSPAHRHAVESAAEKYQFARQRVSWNNRVRQVWDRVSFVDTGASPTGAVTSGRPVAIQTSVDLAGLAADDVRVEAVLGPIGATGCLEDAEVIVLKATGQNGSATLFSREVTPAHTGRLGYAFRISPNHFEDPLTRPCATLMKWAR